MAPEDIQMIAWALREALEGIHGIGFVHCDIKLDNILIQNQSDTRSVVLADFGLSHQIPADGILSGEEFGTSSYQAPEV
jgi:serine/threonine protein kinase